MRVLLLEDNIGVANIIKDCLDSWGNSTLHLHTGATAWKCLNEMVIDLLIVDWNLPDLSGTELVRKVRTSGYHRDLAILMISGQAGRAEMVDAIAAGINGFLAKPFTPLQLKEKVDEVLQVARQPPRTEQLKHACENLLALAPEGASPIVLLGEPTRVCEDLQRDENKKVADYLMRVIAAIDEINGDASEREQIHCLADDTSWDIVQRINKEETRERIFLALLSADCIGATSLHLRLLEINKNSGMTIVIVCDDPSEIPADIRAVINTLGFAICTRDELDRDRLRQLIGRQVAAGKDALAELGIPSAQTIRRRIEEDLETVTALPTLPRVYQKIVQLSLDPDSDLAEWIDVLKIDPMACATIIRHAHSPVYGFSGKVDDIERAATLLGKITIKNLVASESLKRAFRSVEEKGFLLEDFWLHSATVGFAALVLAFPLQERYWSVEERAQFQTFRLDPVVIELLKKIDLPQRLQLDRTREDPFVGGLMHDIGKVVMAQSYPGLFPLIVEQLERYNWAISASTAEEEVAGGLSHAIAGEILGRRWGLRDRVCQVIGGHHKPASDDAYVFLIGAADIMGQVLHPFPSGPRSAVGEALAAKSLNWVKHMLPEGFFDQAFLSSEEFCLLAEALSPTVRRLTEELREAVAK